MWFTRSIPRQYTFVESASDSLKSYLICVYHQKITDRDNRYFITDANTDNTTAKATYGVVTMGVSPVYNEILLPPAVQDLGLSLGLTMMPNCVGCEIIRFLGSGYATVATAHDF
jgi:hypothetical protein